MPQTAPNTPPTTTPDPVNLSAADNIFSVTEITIAVGVGSYNTVINLLVPVMSVDVSMKPLSALLAVMFPSSDTATTISS